MRLIVQSTQLDTDGTIYSENQKLALIPISGELYNQKKLENITVTNFKTAIYFTDIDKDPVHYDFNTISTFFPIDMNDIDTLGPDKRFFQIALDFSNQIDLDKNISLFKRILSTFRFDEGIDWAQPNVLTASKFLPWY